MKDNIMSPATKTTESVSVECFEDYVNAACNVKRDNLFHMLKAYGFRIYNRVKDERHALRLSDNPSAPLIVCHADTVRSHRKDYDWITYIDPKTKQRTVSKRPALPKPDYSYHYDQASGIVNSLALDDRLGIALMLMMIDQRHPMSRCHMLVCDNEEIGGSTASVLASRVERSAKLRKRFQPNWMVELDRRGTDAVMYEYRSDILEGLLKSVGFPIGSGSFSDICQLDDLGCAGFNIGIGYHDEHTERCFASLHDTLTQYVRLSTFWRLYQHVPLYYSNTYSSRYSYGGAWNAGSSYTGRSHRQSVSDPPSSSGNKTPGRKLDRDYLPAHYSGDTKAIVDNHLAKWEDSEERENDDSDPLVKCDSCSEEYPLSETSVWCGNYLLCQDCSNGVQWDDMTGS